MTRLRAIAPVATLVLLTLVLGWFAALGPSGVAGVIPLSSWPL